jgi:pyruvate dehydrogenase E1 component
MVEAQRDVFYYVTVMNENYAQPSMPTGDGDHGDHGDDGDDEALREGILKGMHRLQHESNDAACVQLLGSGAILGEVLAAQRMLKEDWGVHAAVWSVTSFTELQRDGIACERLDRLGAAASAVPPVPYVSAVLGASRGPVIAATDYVRAVPELIRAYVPRRYVTLGTDGFGRSDTRGALREFFEVDRASIVLAALKALADEQVVDAAIVQQARQRYGKQVGDAIAPWQK